MRFRRPMGLAVMLVAFALVAASCGDSDDTTTSAAAAGGTETEATDFKFGMILVGPANDRGWSQAHREAGEYLEAELGAEMILLDSVNPADRPDTTVEQVIDDMVAQGAQLVFATSDDMKDGVEAGAANHPDVPMIWSSGDSAWADGEAYRSDLENLGNIMGRMYWGKHMAGCAAALTSQTGRIAYLGPLINDETRRLANSVYLGAQHCWEQAGNNPDDLEFEVDWIGFWFNIPGVTLDPTEVTNAFIDGGADVVVSGIDTTEGLVRSGQRAEAGEEVWAVPYDYEDACAEAPAICLGVPYFNWGPSYLETAQAVIDGSYSAQWRWLPPDWNDINDPQTSMIGWFDGDGLSDDNSDILANFITGLGDGSIKLFVGPLNYQDGTSYLGDGEQADDHRLWYTKQLLEGMEGASATE